MSESVEFAAPFAHGELRAPSPDGDHSEHQARNRDPERRNAQRDEEEGVLEQRVRDCDVVIEQVAVDRGEVAFRHFAAQNARTVRQTERVRHGPQEGCFLRETEETHQWSQAPSEPSNDPELLEERLADHQAQKDGRDTRDQHQTLPSPRNERRQKAFRFNLPNPRSDHRAQRGEVDR